MAKSPIGTAATQARSRRARQSSAYRAEQERLAQFEELARLVIRHRAALGISRPYERGESRAGGTGDRSRTAR